MASTTSEDALKTLGAVAVGAGVAYVLGTAIVSAQKRNEFARQVGAELAPSDVVLLSSVLGREAEGAIWSLTVRLPADRVLTLELPVHPTHDPFAPETVRSVTSRIRRYLRAKRLIAA